MKFDENVYDIINEDIFGLHMHQVNQNDKQIKLIHNDLNKPHPCLLV